MATAGQKLIIISRGALLDAEPQADSELVFRQLSRLNRKGYQLLLTAAEPDHWVPTRGSVDHALKDQGVIQQRIQQAGGDLDGVYYVPRSLLTQDRNRAGALQDILKRYATSPEQAILVSSSIPFLKAASRLGIQTREIGKSLQDSRSLLEVLRNIS